MYKCSQHVAYSSRYVVISYACFVFIQLDIINCFFPSANIVQTPITKFIWKLLPLLTIKEEAVNKVILETSWQYCPVVHILKQSYCIYFHCPSRFFLLPFVLD